MHKLSLPANSQSQSFQDAFVLNLLNFKKNGYFIEIGSNHPVIYSNTFLLEYKYQWSGLAFELSKSLVKKYREERKALVYRCDATRFNYLDTFSKVNAPKQIDYLQIDIEPAWQSYQALTILPHNLYRFSVITFEHDCYASLEGVSVKQSAYDFLSNLGYFRVVDNMRSKGCAYEDWYCDPRVFNIEKLKDLAACEIEDIEYFSKATLIS